MNKVMTNPDNAQSEKLAEALFGHLLGADIHPATEAAARGELSALGSQALPMLLERLTHPSFWVKKRAYDLIIELGLQGSIAPKQLSAARRPAVRLWLHGVLRFLKVRHPRMKLTPQLVSKNSYVRHLTALSLTFLGDVRGELIYQVVPVLIEALEDRADIEGSGLSIAGAALNCISDLSGKTFFSEQADVMYLNFQEALFPPPIAPFPLTGDQVTTVSDARRAEILAAVEQWWEAARSADVAQFRVLPDPYAR